MTHYYLAAPSINIHHAVRIVLPEQSSVHGKQTLWGTGALSFQLSLQCVFPFSKKETDQKPNQTLHMNLNLEDLHSNISHRPAACFRGAIWEGLKRQAPFLKAVKGRSLCFRASRLTFIVEIGTHRLDVRRRAKGHRGILHGLETKVHAVCVEASGKSLGCSTTPSFSPLSASCRCLKPTLHRHLYRS